MHSNSVGNLGTDQSNSPIPFNVGAPANAPSPWLHPAQYLVGGRASTLGVGAVTQSEIARDQSSRGPADWEDIGVYYPSYPFPMPAAFQDYPFSGGAGGLLKPDLCAPGEGTLSTDNGGGYVLFNGTSAANPHVAGAMAILLEARPSLTPEQIDMILQTTAKDLGDPGKDNVYGAGLLDVYAALQMALNFDTYGRLDATVINAASGDSLAGCDLTFSAAPGSVFTTNELGQFSYPAPSGPATLLVSRFGYEPDTTLIDIVGDSTHVVTIALDTLMTASLSGRITDRDSIPLPNVSVSIIGSPEHATTTDAAGRYEFADAPTGINLTVQAVRFNYRADSDTVTILSAGGDSLDIALTFGMWDDFELDQGWTVGDSLDDAVDGFWERGDPNGTFVGGTVPVQPDSDYTANGTLCFFTENCNVGAGPDFSDVDGGRTSLISPIFDATPYPAPRLTYRRWYTNDAGGAADDSFLVQISSDGGTSWALLESVTTSVADWIPASINIASAATVTDSMRLRFVAIDTGANSIVEAAIDDVRIIQDVADVPDPGESATESARLQLYRSGPNPFDESATLRFDIPHAAPVRVEVFDVQGRRVRTLHKGWLNAGPHKLIWDGRDDRGFPVASGIYFSRLEWQKQVRTQRMVRVN